MIISTKHNFIFVHIPKNAGSSLTTALEAHVRRGDLQHYARSQQTKHQLLSEILSEYDKLPLFRRLTGRSKIDRFYRFAVARNPFDRMVSLYHYLVKTEKRKEISTVQSFEEFILLFRDPKSWVHSMYSLIPQYKYVENQHGQIAVNRICYFETLRQDLKKVESDLGFKIDLPHKNSSSHADYSSYYEKQELVDIVRKHFAQDFERFNYSTNVA